jgi:hypothetical protein
VSPGVLALVGADAPTRTILCAGAGSFEAAYITLTPGVFLGDGPDVADQIVARWPEITDRNSEVLPESSARQGNIELRNAGYIRPATEAK